MIQIMKARYVRVSHQSQNPARQLAKQHPDEQMFVDVISGTVPFINRPEASKLIEAIEAGKINQICVSDVSRLGRNAFDIQFTLNVLSGFKCTVTIDNLGINSILPNGKPNPVFKIIVDVLSNISEMEREAIKEKQAEGIAIAKLQKKFKGRVKGTSETDEEILNKYKVVVKELQLHPDLSLAKIASICNDKLNKDDKKLSPNTVRKVKLILEKQKQ